MFFCIGCETAALGVTGIPVIGYLLTRFRAWRAARAPLATPQRDPDDEAETFLVADGDAWEEVRRG